MSSSAGERKFAVEGAIAGVRLDGRPCLEYRRLSVALGVLPQCHGSARATLAGGGSDILASVKVEIAPPPAGAPDSGAVSVSAMMWTGGGGGGGRSDEDAGSSLAASLSALLLGSGGLDARALCIVAGQHSWHVAIDVVVLRDGGSSLDAAAIAAVAALRDARLPVLRLLRGEAEGAWELELDEDPLAWQPLPGIATLPLTVSFTQLRGASVVDALPEEEAAADSRVVIAATRAGAVVAARATGRAGVTPDCLQACLRAAERVAPALFSLLDGAMAEDAAEGGAPRAAPPGTALLQARAT